jgi:hypothetical protein
MKTESLKWGKGPLKERARVPSLSLYPSDLLPSLREKNPLTTWRPHRLRRSARWRA